MALAVPSVECTIGGKQYRLAFTLGAIKRIRIATGKPLEQVKLSGPEMLEVLGPIVWALIERPGGEDKDVPPVALIEEGVLPSELQALAEAVGEAIALAHPDAKEAGADADPSAKKPRRKKAKAGK